MKTTLLYQITQISILYVIILNVLKTLQKCNNAINYLKNIVYKVKKKS